MLAADRGDANWADWLGQDLPIRGGMKLCADGGAPFSNCLIQNGDLGGEVELINLPLIFVVYCSNYNGAPVKMVSFSTVPPPPVESETLHGRLKRGAG